MGALLRRFRLNASVVWRRRGPQIFRRDARRQANVGRRKREPKRSVALATAKRRRLAKREAGTLARIGDGGKSGPPKSPPGNAEIFWGFSRNDAETAARFGRFASASKKSPDFRLQQTEITCKRRRFGRFASASKKSPDFRLRRTETTRKRR